MSDDIRPPVLGRWEERPHVHKWFPWQTKTPFEPVQTVDGVTLFAMQEYAYLNCNCGAVFKTKVLTKEEVDG